MQTRIGWTLGILCFGAFASATPVDDLKNGVDMATKGLPTPYTITGVVNQNGTSPEGAWVPISKAGGTLNGSVDLFALAPELNIHVTAIYTGTQTASNKVKWVISAPDAIGQNFVVDVNGTPTSVTVKQVAGTMNALVANVHALGDPVTKAGRNVQLDPDTAATNSMKVVVWVNNLFFLPVTYEAKPLNYLGYGGTSNRISGALTLQNWLAAVGGQSLAWTLESAGSTVDSGPSVWNTDGTFDAYTSLSGAHKLLLKGEHWLSGRRDVTVALNTNGANFSLLNGDCDGDNSVTIFDYIILSDSFDKSTGDSGFDARSDLDGDGTVSIFDYTYLSDNFERSGPIDQ